MAKLFISLLFFLLIVPASGQEFFFKQYRVENGLPSDIVKGCAQDSLGFFWIATDDGLVKYDGLKFTTYREAMHSNFAKGFLTTRSGRLFAFGDLDLIEIKNLGDSVLFKSICPVARNSNDSSLTYPKLIYEDVRGNIWVSESQAVVKITGNTLKRYEFDLANRSPQFLRSFAFFEDLRQNLYISSFQGNVFRYHEDTDKFTLEPEKFPNEVEQVAVFGERLFIGSIEGLFECQLSPDGGFGKRELKLNTPYVSHMTRIQGDKYFVATRNTTHFIADLSKNTFTPIKHSITNINHVFISNENDIWISGNDGLIVMKENLIQEASDKINNFIEAITEDPVTGKIFYATNTTLYSYDPKTGKNNLELHFANGYYQSILFNEKGLWIANAFNVYLCQNSQVLKQCDFSKDGRFITDLCKDPDGNIWLAVPGNADVYQIDRDFQLKRVRIPLGREGTINMVCDSKDGVYVASTGKQSYLFFKSKEDSVFKNISVPFRFTTHGDFNVTDIVIDENLVWLASSEGLLKFDRLKIERVNLGPTFSELPIKSIKAYPNNQLLLANAFGMILFDPKSGAYDLFNESSGLLSNTVTPHGLFVAQNKSVWIGTSKGLCFSTRPLTNLKKTPLPRFIETRTNGKRVRIDPDKEIEYGSFITLAISSITFPEKEITIQYRFKSDSAWQVSTGSEINFSNLAAGKYELQVRSKKNGPYSWSDISSLKFKIAKPFWQRAWFFFLCAIATGTIVAITVLSANARHKKRNQELQQLIAERTTALRITNEELAQRNDELDKFVYSASHDLSAPLKSILGLISVAQMEKPDASMSNYLDLMKRSILKLDSFIKDIISYSRNTRLDIKKEPIDFTAMIESIWSDLSFTPDADKIKFEVINELKSEFKSDETRLRIIFNNLLSNAIKFHQKEKQSFIKVIAREFPSYHEFTVQDNGIGISEKFKEKIFDMFFRANETVQGSGLGLYILKETLAKLKGTVNVESALGEGTKFIIQLPKQSINFQFVS